MQTINKSIVAKAFIAYLVTSLLLSAVAYVLVPREALRVVIALLVGFGLLACIYTYVILQRPLDIVFSQMKALLTGRPYKKIFTTRTDEVGVLAHFFNDVTKSIERISQDITEGKRMSKELSVGSDIQRKMIPTNMPKVEGLEIFGSTRPASEVGGDSFDVISAPNSNTMMYVGDVTGHGLPAGLVMVMVNTLIRTLSEIYQSGYEIMMNTNRIIKSRIEQHRFMTCVLLRWNTMVQKMYYTGCGHEHILIYHAVAKNCEVRKTGGIALGMVPDISKIIREDELPFEKNDFIVLYSDGIIEAKNMTGEMFTVERLAKIIEGRAETSTPEELFVTISKSFSDFVGEQTQADDITLIIVKRS